MKTVLELGSVKVELYDKLVAGKEVYKITYNAYTKDNLDYSQAAEEFGLCCFNEMVCAGKTDYLYG